MYTYMYHTIRKLHKKETLPYGRNTKWFDGLREQS